MEYIQTTISKTALDELLKQNQIQDYTDDGLVYTTAAGWIPVGDILEFLIYSEVFYEEEEARH